MERRVAFLQRKPVKIRTLSRHVLDINLALFYVVHVIHGLLKFGEYCSFNSVEKNTWYMKC